MISFLFLLEKRNVNETCNIANLFRKYKKKNIQKRAILDERRRHMYVQYLRTLTKLRKRSTMQYTVEKAKDNYECRKRDFSFESQIYMLSSLQNA